MSDNWPIKSLMHLKDGSRVILGAPGDEYEGATKEILTIDETAPMPDWETLRKLKAKKDQNRSET